MGEINKESFTCEQKKAYFNHLINKTFKILHLKEDIAKKQCTVNDYKVYITGFQKEIIGFGYIFDLIENEPIILSMISILEYLSKYDCDHDTCKKEVFKCIHIIENLGDKYVK